MRRPSPGARTALALLSIALTVPPPGAAAAPAATPDLVVAKVSNPPASAVVGGVIGLRDDVVNRGPGRAGASATRFYLSADAARSLRDRVASTTDPRTSDLDVRLSGARVVPALGARRTARARRATPLGVPVGTRPGVYRVLACADDRGAVRESVEHRNCTVARRSIRILAAPDDTAIVALSDEFEQPDEADDRAAVALLRATSCKATQPLRRMTVRRAISSARAALTQRAGADAMAAFAASPEFRSAGGAQEASVLALTAARPGAALAALLRAHDLQPRRAAHLRNAAAMAASLGLASEALGLLDGAARPDDQPLAGMGIEPQAAALAVRGQALALLGRWPQARSALQAAVTREPLLAEASRSLAAATACTGADDPLPILRRSRLRRTPAAPLDTSHGREHPLRRLVLPFSPEQAAPMRDVYRAETEALLREGDRLNQQRTQHERDLRAAEPTTTRAERRRREGVMARILDVHRELGIVAAQARVDERTAKAEATVYDFWGNGEAPHRYGEFQDVAAADCAGSDEPDCFTRRMREQCIPALRLAHQTWVDQVNDVWRAADARHRLFAKRVSGIGANLVGAPANGLVRTIIEEDEHALYFSARTTVIGWTVPVKAFADHCVSAPEPAPATEQGTAAAADACPQALKGVNVVAKAGAFSLKVSCESIQFGGKLEAMPWLAGFAEATYDPRAGRITVFAGSKGEIDTLKVAKGAFKSGVYLTVSNVGLEDWGSRLGDLLMWLHDPGGRLVPCSPSPHAPSGS